MAYSLVDGASPLLFLYPSIFFYPHQPLKCKVSHDCERLYIASQVLLACQHILNFEFTFKHSNSLSSSLSSIFIIFYFKSLSYLLPLFIFYFKFLIILILDFLQILHLQFFVSSTLLLLKNWGMHQHKYIQSLCEFYTRTCEYFTT